MTVVQLSLTLVILLLLNPAKCQKGKPHDPPVPIEVHEGDNVTMKCPTRHQGPNIALYWTRANTTIVQNIAIGDLALDYDYMVSRDEEKYDLVIQNVSYKRDTVVLECHIRQGGPGTFLDYKTYRLVVLMPPKLPTISPSGPVQVKEGQEIKLSCLTVGGVPEPTITWFRDGNPTPLEAEILHGKTRDIPSVSTLTLTPKHEDNGASFRCVVWNKALPQGNHLDASIKLNVS